MGWKDDHRDEKDASGMTWDEFHRARFVHVDDIAAEEVEEIQDHLDAVRREYRDLKREIHEVRVMMDSDEYDP